MNLVFLAIHSLLTQDYYYLSVLVDIVDAFDIDLIFHPASLQIIDHSG